MIFLELGMGDILGGVTSGLLSISFALASSLAMAFAVCVIGFNYVKNALNSFQEGNEGKAFDPVFVGRVLIILSALGMYQTLVGDLAHTITSINKAYSAGDMSAQKELYQKKVEQFKSQDAKTERKKLAEGTLASDKATEQQKEQAKTVLENLDAEENRGFIEGIGIALREALMDFFQMIVQLLTGLIRTFVITVNVYFARILIILGPFPLALAIFPSMMGVFINWLKSTVAILLAGAVFNICDHFIIDIYEQLANMNMGLDEYNSLKIIGFDFSIIALYFGVFKIASMAIGASENGITDKVVSTIGFAFGFAGGLSNNTKN